MLSVNFFILFSCLVTHCIVLVIVNIKSSLLLKQIALMRSSPYDSQDNIMHKKVISTLHIITFCFVVCLMPYAFYALFLGAYLQRRDARLANYFGYLKNFMPFHVLYLLNSGLTAAEYVIKNGRGQTTLAETNQCTY